MLLPWRSSHLITTAPRARDFQVLKMEPTTMSLTEKLDKIRSPNLQSQQQVWPKTTRHLHSKPTATDYPNLARPPSFSRPLSRQSKSSIPRLHQPVTLQLFLLSWASQSPVQIPNMTPGHLLSTYSISSLPSHHNHSFAPNSLRS